MYRTGKHHALVDDPVIKYKSVEALPGIGPVSGGHLRDAGFHTADQVLAQYLAFNKNEYRFTTWLSTIIGANSRWTAQCFQGVNEWYNKWLQDVQVPKFKKAISPTPERPTLTNHMLLDQKILQFNFNSSDDRLRGLNHLQALSLFDVSRPIESAFRESGRLHKSHVNIMEVSPNKYEPKQHRSTTNLLSPTQKSVNFAENEFIDIHTPKKTPLHNASRSSISPILKSRSVTPENKKSNNFGFKPLNWNVKPEVKSLNNRMASKTRVASMNNLNTGTYKKPPMKFGNPMNTRAVSTTTIRVNNAPKPVLKIVPKKPSPIRSSKAPQNIGKYFNGKPDAKVSRNSSTPMKKSQRIYSSDSISPYDSLDESNDTEQSITAKPTIAKHVAESELTTTEEETYEPECLEIENDKISADQRVNDWIESTALADVVDSENYESLSKDFEDVSEISEMNDSYVHRSPTPPSNIDNSNEDSGLEVTSNIAKTHSPVTETRLSDDENSAPFETIDSLTGSDTDRTFEVNETTDAESGFHYVTNNSGTDSEKDVAGNEEEQLLAKKVVVEEDSQSECQLVGDDVKRNNVRLFCDMLSSDLEQLPMERLRSLKLKILQLVYNELNGCEKKE